ncbi:bifunctional adenosylcobinamide kinase/adenosylcobinamide-phosphate guanylyltransferase [Butyrivibrio sp. MC2013]|uniref:bifunctional adenosylcobinamide kinase/adenosylcobinamide-phosphate guanylyltransferase n=1 Tax=Butyrivibrio sp. MC2013 TaxID=1280686 RepID=UPI0004215747|nr:bifunctional adenosylcobinamide kinase/adenosylcobinamide-phosphate guanylyltransferase [Butyrivibrio sp. MC2013]
MIHLVIGGSASGKSEYAEELVLKLSPGGSKAGHKRYYLATMKASDTESLERIDKHKRRRQDMEYETLEYSRDIDRAAEHISKKTHGSIVLLLEDLPCLCAGEMFGEGGSYKPDVSELIMEEILQLSKVCDHMVIVTGDLYRDGVRYDDMTENYLFQLAEVTGKLAAISEDVTELVYSIPVRIGGRSV